ncbi:MAG: hypothetical protein ACOVOR_05245 [Rhabdochlamydiaceae bacterium]
MTTHSISANPKTIDPFELIYETRYIFMMWSTARVIGLFAPSLISWSLSPLLFLLQMPANIIVPRLLALIASYQIDQIDAKTKHPVLRGITALVVALASSYFLTKNLSKSVHFLLSIFCLFSIGVGLDKIQQQQANDLKIYEELLVAAKTFPIAIPLELDDINRLCEKTVSIVVSRFFS